MADLSYVLVQATMNTPLVRVKLLTSHKQKPRRVLVLVLMSVWTQP